MTDQSHQYRAFMSVVLAMLIVAVFPMAASWALKMTLPDGLLQIADKAITAFGTLLGGIGALMFRQNRIDEVKATNDADALKRAQESPSSLAPPKVEVINTPDNPVPIDEARS